MKFSIRFLLVSTLIAGLAFQYLMSSKQIGKLTEETHFLASEIAGLQEEYEDAKLRSAIYGGGISGRKRLIQHYEQVLQSNEHLIHDVAVLQNVRSDRVSILKMLGIEDNFLASYKIYLPKNRSFYLDAIPSDCDDLFADGEPQSVELVSGTSRLTVLFGELKGDATPTTEGQRKLLVLQDDRVVIRYVIDKQMPDCRVRKRLDAKVQRNFAPEQIPMLMELRLESYPMESRKRSLALSVREGSPAESDQP